MSEGQGARVSCPYLVGMTICDTREGNIEMDELIKAMADGKPFDLVEGMRALAKKLVALDAEAAKKDALLTNVNGRAAGGTDGATKGKKK